MRQLMPSLCFQSCFDNRKNPSTKKNESRISTFLPTIPKRPGAENAEVSWSQNLHVFITHIFDGLNTSTVGPICFLFGVLVVEAPQCSKNPLTWHWHWHQVIADHLVTLTWSLFAYFLVWFPVSLSQATCVWAFLGALEISKSFHVNILREQTPKFASKTHQIL